MTVFSKRQKSPMEGAQYMHVEIPGIKTHPPEIIRYMLFGSIDAYRDKVYGAGDPDITVSPQQFLGDSKCWDLRYTYNQLWLRWGESVINVEVRQPTLETIVGHHDYVFSTIPATALCTRRAEWLQQQEHKFTSVPVWIDGRWSGPTPAEDRGMWDRTRNVVICNGFAIDEERHGLTGWYRTSHIYGHANTEWANPALIPDQRHIAGKVWRVRKPLRTNCSCWPQIIRAGRYGKWEKGQLTNDAFDVAMGVLS